MDFKQRLTDLLVQKNHSQAELARYVGVKNNTVSDWINKGTSPKIEHLYRIAEFFEVSYDVLMTGKEKSPSLPNDEQELLSYYKKLPEREQMKLIGRAATLAELYEEQVIAERRVNTISLHCADNRVSAGIGDELYDYEQWDTVDVEETKESRKADFILIVHGDSMEPKFHDGDYVLVRQQPAVAIGQIGIFYVDGKGFIKKFEGDTLVSLNPDYEDISLLDKEFRCFGLVLGTAELV